jgi:hypothetical protein
VDWALELGMHCTLQCLRLLGWQLQEAWRQVSTHSCSEEETLLMRGEQMNVTMRSRKKAAK